MIVAIDGPAGVGKSSIAKMIADHFGYYYLNSGLFYRGVTYKVLNSGVDPSDKQQVEKIASSCVFDVIDGRFHLDGVDVQDRLHNQMIDLNASKISVNPNVREIVNNRIHELTGHLDIVAEGRDITTVVFPDAPCKFFFDAKPEVRATRRFEQNPSDMPYEQVLKEIIERDEIDRNKPVGGLKIAKDAIYVDTSYLTISQVCEKVYSDINVIINKLNSKGSGEKNGKRN